ncbi:unnamed protein product [Brachionus calyciflorus]|uniref:Uncharacterized protein n=1 Tax=Brachionus calyciflorus TaxID=104777 RepID=A0A813MA84_9BILA|nr:unnamed protein product [Brachionus calyciflorus]
MDRDIILGIDLGTSYIKSGYYANGLFEDFIFPYVRCEEKYKADVITKQEYFNEFDKNIVCFDSKILIQKSVKHYENNYLTRWPFKLNVRQEKYFYDINEEPYYPEFILGKVLQRVREIGERISQRKINKAVITCPASFGHLERQAIIDSARIAQLEIVSLLNDNTATAIAITHFNTIDNRENIFVIDLGAYFLNLTIFELRNGFVKIKKAQSFPGLGGQVFDLNTAKYLAKNSKNFVNTQDNFQKLILACEKAKIALNEQFHVRTQIDNCIIDLQYDEFLEINYSNFQAICQQVFCFLIDSNIELENIDDILFIGGSSRIIELRNMLDEQFQKFGKKIFRGETDVTTTVACGAIVHAGFLAKNEMKCSNGFNYIDITCQENYFYVSNDEQIFDIDIKKFTELPFKKDLLILSKGNSLNLVFNQDMNQLCSYKDNKPAHTNEICVNIDKNGLVEVFLGSGKTKINLIDKEKHLTDKKIDTFKILADHNESMDFLRFLFYYTNFLSEYRDTIRDEQQMNQKLRNCFESEDFCDYEKLKEEFDLFKKIFLNKIRADKFENKLTKYYQYESGFLQDIGYQRLTLSGELTFLKESFRNIDIDLEENLFIKSLKYYENKYKTFLISEMTNFITYLSTKNIISSDLALELDNQILFLSSHNNIFEIMSSFDYECSIKKSPHADQITEFMLAMLSCYP